MNAHVQQPRDFGRLSAIVLILAGLFAVGCGATLPSGPHAQEQAALNAAKTLWKSQSLSDYTYVFARSCFCAPESREPVLITVRGGVLISAVSQVSGAARNTADYQTVEGLFGVIQGAIDDGASSIQAEYDPRRGYLTSAYIDVDKKLADEEISITATALTPAR